MSDEDDTAGTFLVPRRHGELVSATNALAQRGLDLIRKGETDRRAFAIRHLAEARKHWNAALRLWEPGQGHQAVACVPQILYAYSDGLIAATWVLGKQDQVMKGLAPDEGWSADPETWTDEGDVHLAIATRLLEEGWLKTDIREQWRSLTNANRAIAFRRLEDELVINLEVFLDEVERLIWTSHGH